jgi:hypothetical protein
MGLNPGRNKRFSCSPECQYYLWHSTTPLFEGYEGMSLIIHLRLVSILRMSGAMPTLLCASMASAGTTLIFYVYMMIRTLQLF